MAPARRMFTRKSPEPPAGTSSVSLDLPSFNFVEKPPPRRRPERSRGTSSAAEGFPALIGASARAPESSVRDLDDVLYATVSARAQKLADPTLSEDVKRARVWQAMLRHSERGRFGCSEAGGVSPICSALCLQATDEILAACGASALLRSVLLGGLANSIYLAFDPEQEFEGQQQYADVSRRQTQLLEAQTQEIQTLKDQREVAEQRLQEQLSAAGVGQILQQMELSRRIQTVTELVTPVLDDGMLLVLWNATATAQASMRLQQRIPVVGDGVTDAVQSSISWNETRKRAAGLASLVLQERVRLVVLVWQALSLEEKRQAHKALDPTSSSGQVAATLKTVLHTLEETYVSEQIHHQRQLSRRNLNMSSNDSVTGKLMTLTPSAPRALGKLRVSKARAHTLLTSSSGFDPDGASAELETSIPQVLLGVLGSPHLGTESVNHRPSNLESWRSRPVSSGILPNQLLASHTDVLRTCEDVFDLLCDAEEQQKLDTDVVDADAGCLRDDSGDFELLQARRKLRDLLCTYVEPSEPISERFLRCERARERRLKLEQERSDDERKLAELVPALIAGQRRHPALLVNAVNRSPETLLSAIASNPGMLLFAITKFADLVKRFLRLDAHACEHLDGLVLKHRGVALLWGSLDTDVGLEPVDPLLFTSSRAESSLTQAVDSMALMTPSTESIERRSLLLLEWFAAHVTDLAEVFLEYPKPLQALFSEMHQRGDVSAFYQLMLLLQQTAGVQNFLSRASVATLERLALEDQAAVLAVLREIFQTRENGEGAASGERINRDLLHELRASPHLVTCLSAFHPTVLQDIFSNNIDAWTPFLVDAVASNDALLRQTLVYRTDHIEGSDTLLRLFTVVTEGSTASLDLAVLDRALCASDVALAKQREASTRRKEQQCMYLRGRSTVFRAVVAPQIATVGYNPRRFLQLGVASMTTTTASLNAASAGDRGSKDSKASRSPLRPRAKRPSAVMPIPAGRKRHPRNGDTISDQINSATSGDGAGSGRATGREVPPMWLTYLRAHAALQSKEDPDGARESLPSLSKARVKALVLDIWLEFLKTDHLQLETASLYAIAPFVCDYLVARYDAPAAVGARLECFLTGLLAFQEDSRVGFFATACGLGDLVRSDATPPSYDVFLYYLHAMGHLFYGQMKIFQPGKRLDETLDGSCLINVQHALATATTLFAFSLTEPAMRSLCLEIEELARSRPTISDLPPLLMEATEDDETVNGVEEADGKTLFVEFDDVMALFLKQWAAKSLQTEERYRQAFTTHDLGGDRIGLDEFIKIVTSVTAGRITARECRLVYGDAGQEFLDLATFVKVTQVYQLRAFDSHLPEVELDEADLQDLRLSVGRANVASTQREVEDLARYWRSVRSDVVHQLDAAHQTKATKALLKKQSALIERLVADTPSLLQQLQVQLPSLAKRQPTSPALVAALQEKLDRVWHEVRVCVKMLHRARLTQHYLSGLFIQSNLVSWSRQARKHMQEDERQRSLQLLNS